MQLSSRCLPNHRHARFVASRRLCSPFPPSLLLPRRSASGPFNARPPNFITPTQTRAMSWRRPRLRPSELVISSSSGSVSCDTNNAMLATPTASWALSGFPTSEEPVKTEVTYPVPRLHILPKSVSAASSNLHLIFLYHIAFLLTLGCLYP